jgi:hypothetical protein
MEAEAEAVLKNARRAAGFAFMCMAIVALLLLIDGQRNRVLIKQIQDARNLLTEFNHRIRSGDELRSDTGNGHVPAAAPGGGLAADGPVAGGDGGNDPAADASVREGNPSDGGQAAARPDVAWPVRQGTTGGPRGNE